MPPCHCKTVKLSLKTMAPNLWDLMPDELRWNWCYNNRNKVHDECDALESSPPPPPLPSTPGLWTNGFPWNQPLVPERLQTTTLQGPVLPVWGELICNLRIWPQTMPTDSDSYSESWANHTDSGFHLLKIYTYSFKKYLCIWLGLNGSMQGL